MAIGRMAAAYNNAVCTTLERFENKRSVDAAGAGEANDPDIWGHADTAGPRKVSACISAPVADERDDARFKRSFCFIDVNSHTQCFLAGGF